jgi:hypothetical protein
LFLVANLKSGIKLSAVAIFALSIGVAYASPLLFSPIDVKPFPVVPEGPKANFSVEVVYANFSTVEFERNVTHASFSGFDVTTYKWINVTYTVILNVTNLSDLEAKIDNPSFAAAEEISMIPSVLGGFSFARAGGPGVNFGGVVEGVWLDGDWVNATWIPGKDYPDDLFRVMSLNNRDYGTVGAIPELPANATEEGTWIEGVPIAEYYDATRLIHTSMYINGAWVDVTGRVTPYRAQPTVMCVNNLVDQILPLFVRHYRNVGNASVGPTTALPGWKMYNGNGPAIHWQNLTGFSNVWAPNQSRLIVLTSTQMFSPPNVAAVSALEMGKLMLYASVSSYVNDWPVDGIYYDTVSTATWIKEIQLQSALNGYVYNPVLDENHIFQLAQNGIEAFIQPRT